VATLLPFRLLNIIRFVHSHLRIFATRLVPRQPLYLAESSLFREWKEAGSLRLSKLYRFILLKWDKLLHPESDAECAFSLDRVANEKPSAFHHDNEYVESLEYESIHDDYYEALGGKPEVNSVEALQLTYPLSPNFDSRKLIMLISFHPNHALQMLML
jgi:hypothetical protein